MRLRPSWTNRAGALSVALLVSCAAAVLPAGAAHAADGTNWSGSWSYSSSVQLNLNADLPGVRIGASGVDSGGTRNLGVQVTDTANDGRCARGLMLADNRVLADLTVCDGQGFKQTGTGNFTGPLTIALYRLAGGGIDKTINMQVPSSAADPALRARDTGLSWHYISATKFQFTVHRTGATLSGSGVDSGINRTVGGILRSEAGAQCALTTVGDGANGGGASVCDGGGTSFLRSTGLSRDTQVTLCAINPTACLVTLVPQAN
jgi:hypothetical protein